jgi:hypothetical protein
MRSDPRPFSTVDRRRPSGSSIESLVVDPSMQLDRGIDRQTGGPIDESERLDRSAGRRGWIGL